MARFGTHFGGACGILLRAEENHTHKPYIDSKYCLVCTCQGMTSPLQSKVPPQNSCATWLGVPFRFTLFKVSAQLVCSWLSYSMQECETPGTSTTQHLQLTQFRCRRCRLDDIKGRSLAKKVFGPVLEGHGASRPARRQITHTNHISMNYKYCIVCACQSITSPLQSKVPP